MQLEWVTLSCITALALPGAFVWCGERIDVNFDMSEYGCTSIRAVIHDKMASFVLPIIHRLYSPLPLHNAPVPAPLIPSHWRTGASPHAMVCFFIFTFFFSKIHSYSFSVQRFVFKLLKFFINFSVSGDCSRQQMGKVAVTLHANLSVYPSVRILFIVLFILPSSIQNICFQMLLTSPFVYG